MSCTPVKRRRGRNPDPTAHAPDKEWSVAEVNSFIAAYNRKKNTNVPEIAEPATRERSRSPRRTPSLHVGNIQSSLRICKTVLTIAHDCSGFLTIFTIAPAEHVMTSGDHVVLVDTSWSMSRISTRSFSFEKAWLMGAG